MTTSPNVTKRLTVRAALILLAITSVMPDSAQAYDPDTHYQLTYVLCRAAGFNHADAVTVAACDQGLDDSADTIANEGIKPKVLQEGKWHALPEVGDPRLILQRKQILFEVAMSMRDRQQQLQYLGVFFHYQQDSWAHRVHPNSEEVAFTPYTQPIGHAMMGHQPDRPPFDPICALRSLEEGIRYAREFLQETGGKPSKFFDNYTPAAGVIDSSWEGKGKFINQIKIDTSTKAHEFLTKLIRAQIDSYTNGLDANPNYSGYYTSNEADYTIVRLAFRDVCNEFGIPMEMPEFFSPLATLTTHMLDARQPIPMPPTPPPAPAPVYVTLQNVANAKSIVAPMGLKYDQWLSCKAGIPVEFEVVGPRNYCALRVKGQDLYLSFRESTGAVKLWNTPEKSYYNIEKTSNGNYTIKNLHYSQYLWSSGEDPYVSGGGVTSNANCQWRIPGFDSVPESPPVRSITLQSASNNGHIVAPDGLNYDEWLYCRQGTPVTFDIVGPMSSCALKVKGRDLYLSFRESTGAVKLWNTPDKAYFRIQKLPNGNYSVYNIYYNQYLWLDGENPYVSGTGSPGNLNSQWTITDSNATPPPRTLVTLRCNANSGFVVAPDGLEKDQWLYCKSGTAVEFEVVGDLTNCAFKVKDRNLYLSLRESTGAVKLWDTNGKANFRIERLTNGSFSIKNVYYDQFLWSSGENPYISSAGNPGNSNAQWTIAGLESIPIPKPPKTVKLQSVANGKFFVATDGLSDDQWLYCKDGTSVQFEIVGTLDNCAFKVSGKELYLSLRESTGAVKLWSTPDKARFRITRLSDGTYSIKNIHYDQYLWLSGESPYITGSGNPLNSNAKWYIPGLDPAPPIPPKKYLRLQGVANSGYITASDGLRNDQWLYCKGGTPVDFEVVGDLSNCAFKVKDQNLYLSLRESTGAVKLWNTPDKARFKIEKLSNGYYSIKNNHFNQYLWISGENPYISGSGNPAQSSAQWIIPGL